MHVVIDISEKEYKKIGLIVEMGLGTNIDEIVANGIVLPKGHGDLIDVDALNRKDVNCANIPMNFIDIAPRIIEADRVGDEE